MFRAENEMERKLTEFQIRCEKCLADALAEIGESVSGRQLAGQSETYIQGTVGPGLTFWIYEDGADFKTRSAHPVFEKSDFDSLDALIEGFARGVVQSLK